MRNNEPRPRHLLLSLLAVSAAACGVDDVDRTQPDKVPKCIFFEEGCETDLALSGRTPREYYFNTTVIDVPASSDVAFVGDTNFRMTNRVTFDIQEDHLYVYRSFPWVVSTDPGQINGGDDYARPGSTGPDGAPIAIFPIESHFDVKRDYNPATGEQTPVIVENTQDRPWYAREYMRVDWSDNLVGDINFTMTTADAEDIRVVPQEDASRDLGKERTVVSEGYIDFVQHVSLEANIIPGSEAWFGFPIPTCWLFTKAHTDCQGGVAKVRYSFAEVPESNYRPVAYDDRRLSEFGAFRTERNTYDDEYGIVEPSVLRLANRWNMLKPGADCYDEDARLPYGTCAADDFRTIVYYLAEDHPEHLREPAVAIGEAWNEVFREAVGGATGRPAAELGDLRLVTVCPHNPVREGDPAECGAPGLNPQIGDLRYSFNYFVPEQHESSPLGFGPSNVDPLTGEIISASAYYYGAPGRWLSRRTLDMFKVAEGMLDPVDLGDGTAVQAGVPEPFAAHALPDRVGRVDRGLVKETVEKYRLKEKAARLFAHIQSGEALHDEAGGKLAKLRASGLDALAVTEEMKRAFGQGAVGELGADAFSAAESVSTFLSDELFDFQKQKERHLRRGPGGRHVHMADEYLEERYLGLFQEIRERFVDESGALDEPAALRYVEARAFIDTQLHEIGHTLGMMHNFAGSADAINFDREWWTLRAAGGLVEGKRPAQEFDLRDAEGYQGSLEAGMRALQSSTSMEYMSTYGTDLDPGRYDVAWVKYVYFDTKEIFDTAHPDVNIDTERAGLFERGALHYTYYPELVSDAASYEARVDALYRRANANFRQVDEDSSLIGVPYRFCGDSYVGGAQDCNRWDQGVDAYERVMKYAKDYENYYWFNAFKRERLAFGVDVYSYIARLYSRTFEPMVNQYKHWVNEELIVRRSEPCVWWEDGQRQEAADRFTATACGLAGYAASVETLNELANVINTPARGCYVRLAPGCYETPAGNTDAGGTLDLGSITRVSSRASDCDTHVPNQPGPGVNAPFGDAAVATLKIQSNSPYYHLDDTTQCPRDANGAIDLSILDAVSGESIAAAPLEIGLGTGKPSRTVYDREEYGYNFYWKPTIMGSWWEKWMAVKALSDPYTNFIGVDASADTASYLISLTTLFAEEVNQIVAGAVAEEPGIYGRVIANDEVTKLPVISLRQRGLLDPSRARNPVIAPDQEYTFRLMSMMNAAFQSSFISDDYEFVETLNVGRTYSLADVDLPQDLKGDPSRFTSLRDPVTGEIWWAVKSRRSLSGGSTPIYSLAYEMLREMKRRYYEGGAEGSGEVLLSGVPEWQPRGDIRFLNIMRGTASVFGSAAVGSGDVGF